MFERRLAWLVGILCGLALLIVARLVDVQIVRAAEYEKNADRLLTQPLRVLRAPRGRILDRNDQSIAADVPASDVSVHYAILSGESSAYLETIARAMQQRGMAPRSLNRERDAVIRRELVSELRVQIAEMWQKLSELTGEPVSAFIERAERIRQRVQRIRAETRRRTGVDQAVKEETRLHPIISGADSELALTVRLALERFTWLRLPMLAVEPATRRKPAHELAFSHLIGRLGAVSESHLANDPLAGDDLRRLLPDEQVGVSGVELLAETALRGARGWVLDDFDRNEIERRAPQAGGDVRLTIDARLQEAAYEILAEAVEASEFPAGGAVVVLDSQSREILALVSYPSYDATQLNRHYAELAEDTRRLPLMFRAIEGQYPPGSTCKAITLFAALAENVITPESTFHCRGYLLPNRPDQFRCWIFNQYGSDHGTLSAAAAIQHSCNVFFFQAGQRVGPGELCRWFDRFGLGRSSGSGLVEERTGVVPDEDYLRATQERGFEPADAWNYAIGQGELLITPLQSANVAATVATGQFALPRLVQDGLPTRQATSEAVLDPGALRPLRDGMWRVVNESRGTAPEARLDHPGVVLCGKTGSAQTLPRVLNWEFEFQGNEGAVRRLVAIDEETARKELGDGEWKRTQRRAAERFPPWQPGDRLPSHAWFIGYTQAASAARGAAPEGRSVSIAVLIEFGGSGGKVAGPVAKRVIEAWLALQEQG